jgi:hypothetical protein
LLELDVKGLKRGFVEFVVETNLSVAMYVITAQTNGLSSPFCDQISLAFFHFPDI